MRENSIILEYHSDVSLGWIQVINSFVIEVKISSLNGIKSGNHTKECCLPATGRPQQGEKLAFMNI